MPFRPLELILSCEHGGNRVPARYRRVFSEALLATHRGYDPGALTLARDFAAATGAPLFYSTISRLLVELNRPLGHHQIFSARVLRLPLLHLSCHSFTPRLAGVARDGDLGLLFDPKRTAEARFCDLWRDALLERAPRLRVRHNYPYRGTGDALTTSLRKKLAAQNYLGIALEINQKFPRGDRRRWLALLKVLRTTLTDVL